MKARKADRMAEVEPTLALLPKPCKQRNFIGGILAIFVFPEGLDPQLKSSLVEGMSG